MFSTISGFVYRHRRKLLVTGAVVGSIAFVTRYAHRKVLEWQQREMNEFFERTQRQEHFEKNERTCNQTILSLTPTLCEKIGSLLDTQLILDKLRSGSGDKIALWEELKIVSFTRLSLMLYAGTMFVIMLKVQVHVIGGYLYHQSTCNSTAEEVDKQFQEDYLKLCEYFFKSGLKDLCNLIENKVRFVLEGEPLKKKLKLQDIEHLFWAIQSTVGSDPDDPLTHLSKYVLPKDFVIEFTKNKTPLMSHIVNETLDIFETDEIKCLAKSSVSSGLTQIMDQISEFFEPVNVKNQVEVSTAGTSSGDNNNAKDILGFSKVSMPMAKVIPIVNGLTSAAKASASKEAYEAWIQPFISKPNLKLFAANLYESFSNLTSS